MKYLGSSRPLTELPEADFPKPLERKERILSAFELLWDNSRTLYRISLYALLLSTLIAFLVPNRYESTTRLMPPDSQSASGLALAAAAMSGSGGGSLGAMANDFLGLKSSSDIFVGVLTSRTVQDEVIKKFDLKKLYGAQSMEDARKVLSGRTGIGVERKSQIISITVTDNSPQRAAEIGQAYVQELNSLVTDLSTSSARRERIFLEGRLQSVTKDLEAAEKEFGQFASKNTAIDVKEQAKAMVEAAATLQGQLIAAQSQYQGLREIYTDNNPRTRSVKARIDELQRQLEKLGGKGESSTEVASESGDSFYPSIRKLPLLGVAYADLYRRMKIQEAVLETLTKEYEMAKVQEAKEIPSVKILDVANVPDKKSYPPRLLIMGMGTAFAFVAAVIWLLARNEWDSANPHDARKLFAQRVFADVKTQSRGFARHLPGRKTMHR